jgi:hydrogenase/urease accessory protein HupE
MKAITNKLILLAIAALPVLAFAHPGHGHENPLSPGHYVVNPEHFIPLALTVAITLSIVLGYRAYAILSKQHK